MRFLSIFWTLILRPKRRAARVITGQTYDVRSTQILGDLSWIPIEDTLKRREIIMSFKALTDRLPTYLQELFIKCNNDNYYLRSNNSKLALPKPKTNLLKRSFSYIGQHKGGTNYQIA